MEFSGYPNCLYYYRNLKEYHFKHSVGDFRRNIEAQTIETVIHSSIDAHFVAAAEATGAAILNSLWEAEDFAAWDGIV